MAKRNTAFRVGKVGAYLRGKIWYLQYHENGRRRRPRVGPDRDAARQLAAQINGQLETGAPAALSFEPISIIELRRRWLDHHEHVRRSSVQTVRRYRAATEHLVTFVANVHPVRQASDFRPQVAAEFVRYLRTVKVAPNGHRHSRKRLLLDAGVKYILETCSTLFNFAQRHRHLSPYAENPFRAIEIGRIPIEDAKPIFVFTADRERRFFELCDAWQFPLFATLLLTGLRPGELTHLLLPEDLDLETGWLYVRNKPELGWQVKTRNEREIPLMPALVEMLRRELNGRTTGPVFRQRRFHGGGKSLLSGLTSAMLKREATYRLRTHQGDLTSSAERIEQLRIKSTIWRDLGAVKNENIRNEFIALACRGGMPEVSAPKTLRHTFATILQDANVDPLIRNQLMGHAPALTSGLGMTAIYTHTQPETKRRQLEHAFQARPVLDFLRVRWPRIDAEKDQVSPSSAARS